MSKSYELIDTASPVDRKGPHGWIQWKGTNVCCDIHCACGELTHIDADFAYIVKCGKCGALWGMDPNITLVPLSKDDAEGACDPVVSA